MNSSLAQISHMSLKRGKKRLCKDESYDNDDSESKNDSDENNKTMLQTEIQELRNLITEMENNYRAQKNELKRYAIRKNFCHSAEIHCVKFSNNEYEFDVIFYENERQDETYTVQFFNRDNKGQLGKLKIPIGIDIKRILAETPFDNISNAPNFLKNCKRYIDYYNERKKQFDELKSYIKNSINCFTDTNYNFTIINLQLIKVYDSDVDKYYNIIIYLLYDLTNIKPMTIKFESNDKEELENTTRKCLKSCLGCFKTLKLKKALYKISEENNSSLGWKIKFHNNHLFFSITSLNLRELEEESIFPSKKLQSLKHAEQKAKSKLKKQNTSKYDSASYSNNRQQSNTLNNNNSSKCKQKIKPGIKQTKLNFIIEKSTDEINKKSKEIEENKQSLEVQSNQESKETKANKKRKTKEIGLNKHSENVKSKKYIKENIKNFNIKSNDQVQGRKKDDQTVPTSTPVQMQSKSILKQAMRENLDISNITCTESLLPQILQNDRKLR